MTGEMLTTRLQHYYSHREIADDDEAIRAVLLHNTADHEVETAV